MSRDLRRVGKFRRIGRSDKSPACTGSSGFATEEIRKEDLQREDVEFLGILKLFLLRINHQELFLKTQFLCLFRV